MHSTMEKRQIRHSITWRTATIGAFATFVGIGSWVGASGVENRLERSARAALDEAGITASVHFDGRDAELAGQVGTAEESRRASIVVADLPGTRRIRSNLTIISAEEEPATPGTVPQPPRTPSEKSTANPPEPPRGTILFKSEETVLTPAGIRYLEALADYLKKSPGRAVQIAGHTDATGARSLNQRLSERRAEAVAAHLSARGVDTARLITRGFADTRPVASNRTSAGRAANRRVEIVIEGIA